MSPILKTLKALPQEVRDQIFSHLLISPTGMVVYNNSCLEVDGCQTQGLEIIPITLTGPKTSNRFATKKPLEYLSLLLTCRQFYQECREMLCSKNTYFGRPYLNFIRKGKTSVLHDIHHIVFDCVINYNDKDIAYQDLSLALPQCVKWSSISTLQRITLFFAFYASGGQKSYKQAISERLSGDPPYETPFQELLEWVQIDAGHCKSVLQSMKSLRNLLSTSHVKLDIQVRLFNLDRSLVSPSSTSTYASNFNDLMEELSKCLGAKLWIDGIMFYEDGVQVQDDAKIGRKLRI